MTASYLLTFGTTAVALSSVFPAGADSQSASFVSLQAHGGNSSLIYVAGANVGAAVSSTNYGFRIEIPVSTVPPAPTIIELSRGNAQLSELWVKGTSGEKMTILLMA